MSIAYNDTFWYIRGHALHQLKYYEAAIASYDRAIKWGLVSSNKDFYNKVWYYRGQAVDDLKRYKKAIANFINYYNNPAFSLLIPPHLCVSVRDIKNH
jgi:tetratricopeptide (TPR) repeat protein